VAYHFQTEKNRSKIPTEYEIVTHKVSFGNAVLIALMFGRKYDVISQNGKCSRENNVRTSVFSKQSPLSKNSIVTELNMEKFHLEIIISDVGYSNFAAIETVTPQMLENTWRKSEYDSDILRDM
jgi:hypothetical protein